MRTHRRIPDRERSTARTAPGVPVAAAVLAALALLGTAATASAASAADPGTTPGASATATSTATAPTGTATAPTGTATAPTGTAAAPTGTAAAPTGTTAGTATAPAVSGQLPAEAPQSERLAAELRKDPVYVSADLPRQVPRSLAPEFAAVAKRTGVPTYVLVLPDADRTLLAQVHDRLGADGLYVLVEKYGGVTVAAFGVDLPAEDAARIANHKVSYDAGPLARFTAFADKVVQDKDRVAAEVLEMNRNHDDDFPRTYISSTDRQNQNLLLGLAVVLLPGLLLALGLRLSRRRDTFAPAPSGRTAVPGRTARPGGRTAVTLSKSGPKPQLKKGPAGAKDTKAKGAKTAGAKAAGPLRRSVLAVTLLAVVASVLGVVLAAPKVFPQTIDDPDLTVTRADLDARATEAAAALTADGIYQDASAPNPLTAEQLAAVRQRVSGLAAKTPVYLLFTSSNSDDESADNGDILLAEVRRHTGRDGVYVQVDPVRGYLELAEYAPAGTDVESRFRKADLRYPDRESGSDDTRIPDRLNRVLDAVAAAEPTGEEGDSADGRTLPELRSNKLPPLFSNDFGGGIVLGAMLLGLLLLLAWAAIAVTRAVIRSRHARAAGPTPPQHAVTGPRRTAARPTARQLRSWAAEDTRALTVRLAAVDQDAPGRARAWDCLDAAELLLGGNGGRDADPSDLAAATALARAGFDALQGRTERQLCRTNPLHGSATGGKVPAWFDAVDLSPRTARLCPDCLRSLQSSGAVRTPADRAARRATVDGLLLRLPDADGRTTDVWEEAGQVLPAALEGLDALILRARESASVQ
ncbi:hypothetical protein HUT16_07890 [Kitasatospora sp. NA04385]|uniref:hypothetical protein n=1 Tax=Kitasatospora sp. NA04385 TaxID=2742135 RepID=UPI00158FCADF|nr:hypothetical protein [Kitasatospora sp. NA04385]QKW18995.1 hypothetical protein HUT16_07890 [Kitasatospora sp. NA04385]